MGSSILTLTHTGSYLRPHPSPMQATPACQPAPTLTSLPALGSEVRPVAPRAQSQEMPLTGPQGSDFPKLREHTPDPSSAHCFQRPWPSSLTPGSTLE